MASGGKDDTGLAALVSDAESDPRMKELSGEPDGDEREEDGAGDEEDGELDDCLNRAFDAKEKGDRAGFVSAMRQAIKGY